jgi:hypothetical protein
MEERPHFEASSAADLPGPPARQAAAASLTARLLRRLPRITINTFLVLVIVGLLAACYAPVYFGPDAEGRAPRRGR